MPLWNLCILKYLIWWLPGYNLVRADNPANTKRGDIFIYYHNSLPLILTGIQFLNEYINFYIRIVVKLCSFLCLYRSPIQTRDIFETFANNFELTLDTIINKNPFLTVALADFNAKTINWYKTKFLWGRKNWYNYILIWLTTID